MATTETNILGMLNRRNQAANPVNNAAISVNEAKQLLDTLNGSADARATVDQLSQSDPRIANAKNYVDQFGGDAKAAAMQFIQNNGVDMANVKNLLHMFGGK